MEEQKEQEWTVTFEGGFWNPQGESGKEIQINHSFEWEDEKWTIPSIYLCEEGLVVDYCIEINLNKLNSFLDKWNLRDGEYDQFSETDMEQIQQEQPMNICFRSKLICNGRQLESRGGCCISWIPSSCQVSEILRDIESEQCIKKYDLDVDKAWVLWRCSYGWMDKKEEHITSLEISFEREAKTYVGTSIGALAKDDVIEMVNPATGEQYKLTVLAVSDEEYDASIFQNPNMEYPTHFKSIIYQLEPDIDNLSFTLKDCCGGDSPRMIELDENGPVAMAVSVFAGANPSGTNFAKNAKTACSSMHFDQEFHVEWAPCFHEKEMEDILVKISI